MNTKNDEWYDALMTVAIMFLSVSAVTLSRETWRFVSLIFAVIGLALLVLAGVVKIGWHNFIALPQAIVMALQDRRRHGVRK